MDFIGDVSVNGKQGCGTSVKQSPKGMEVRVLFHPHKFGPGSLNSKAFVTQLVELRQQSVVRVHSNARSIKHSVL